MIITKKSSILLFASTLLIITASACQPTPEEPIVVGKDQDTMLEAAAQTPDTSEDGEDDTSFLLSDMVVPDNYMFSTTGADGKLTVSVDAPIRLPDTDILPTAKVMPGQFVQEMVSGMLDYLYGETPYYQQDNRRTKDELQEQILDLKKQIADGEFEDHPDFLEYQQQKIEDLQGRLNSAPEKRDEPKLSDGTMIQDSETGSYSIDVNSVDSDTGYRIASFNCYSSSGISTRYMFERIDESRLYYSNYSSEDDEYYNYTMDGAQRVYSDEDIPDELKEKLGITLADAKGQVQGLLDAAGIEDVACSAAYVMDDHGTGHVDDYSGDASDYAIKLYYTRSINGAQVLPTSEYAQNARTEYDYSWVYESMEVIVTDGGIVDINWHGPCAVSEMITDNTNIIDFEKAAEIFEKKIMTFYEARVDAYGYDSIDIDIDSVELGLLRIKQQNTEGEKAGLYVPIWAFCGTTKYSSTNPDGYTHVGYNHGCDFADGPYIVLAVNAINGSIIDVEAGY